MVETVSIRSLDPEEYWDSRCVKCQQRAMYEITKSEGVLEFKIFACDKHKEELSNE